MSRLSQAIALAADVHEHQTDKAGAPYILHPIRVMEDAMRVTDGDEETGVVAVLHDVFEDNKKYDRQFLIDKVRDTFGSGCFDWLDILTKSPGEDYLESYIQRIIDNSNLSINENLGIEVKMADLRDNMTILRQPTLRDKDLQRIQKYHMAYRMLREAR